MSGILRFECTCISRENYKIRSYVVKLLVRVGKLVAVWELDLAVFYEYVFSSEMAMAGVVVCVSFPSLLTRLIEVRWRLRSSFFDSRWNESR